MKPSICLGTAQFGLDYGVTNTIGKLSMDCIEGILYKAQTEKINFIDTASAYGDAEKKIGKLLQGNNFKIFSKYPELKNKAVISRADINALELKFFRSLKDLKIDKFDTYFIHNTNDLRKDGSGLLKDWLISLKDRNLVGKIGCSIYNSADLHSIPNELLEVVQLPLSIYNQTLFKDGTISNLKENNTLVYVRSLFVQGLLLSDISSWPSWFREEEKNHHKAFLNFAKDNKLSMIELCLDFAKKIAEIDIIILGFTSIEELVEVSSIWKNDKKKINCDYKKWHVKNQKYLDPRNWPMK